MAKILLFADLHVRNSDSISTIKTNETLNEVLNTLWFVKEVSENENVDLIIQLGDFYDNPDKSSTDMNALLSQILFEISLQTPLTIIAGNHDIIADKTKFMNGDKMVEYSPNTLNQYKYFQNITIIDKPTIVNVDNTNIDLVLMPYSNHIKNDFQNLKINKAKTNICLGHFEVKTDWHEKYLENKGNNLITKEELINDYKMNITMLGHIHDQDIIYSSDNKRIEYLGSCRNINFNNVKEKKYIYIWDTDDIYNLKAIENPYTFIYKTINSFEDLTNYVNDSSNEKLAKTKLKYRYTNTDQIKDINKVKHFFKSIRYEKSLQPIVNGQINRITKEELDSLGSLLQNSLLDNDSIIDYCFKFSEPEDKDKSLEVFEIMRRSAKRC